MGPVVILFGGSSSERLVSVASAQNVSAHLPEAACWFLSVSGAVHFVERAQLAAHERAFEREFVPAQPARFSTLDEAVVTARDAVFFLALHGGDGENGVTQRVLERHGVAFTGSGSQASADAFDKARAKVLAAARGVRIAEAVVIPPADEATVRTTLAGLFARAPRWVLKPQADGSSHGLIHLQAPGEVGAAAKELARLKLAYLAETFVAGRELTVGVVDEPGGPIALPVSEVKLIPGGAFDYAGKYLGRGTEEITPAALNETEWAQAQSLALTTHQAVGCFGYSRTDMILTEAAGPVLLEINTLPGMTKASFIPQQLAVAKRGVREFLEQQLTLARTRTPSRG